MTNDPGDGNVLVIEHDAQYARMTSKLLSDAGYRVRLTANCEMATAALEQDAYDFIIMDPSVYKEGTGQFLWTLAASGSTMAHIIVVSSADNIEDLARQIGAWHWIRKPFEPSQLRSAMIALPALNKQIT
jgi:DNA-binding response OmpR family regulator